MDVIDSEAALLPGMSSLTLNSTTYEYQTSDLPVFGASLVTFFFDVGTVSSMTVLSVKVAWMRKIGGTFPGQSHQQAREQFADASGVASEYEAEFQIPVSGTGPLMALTLPVVAPAMRIGLKASAGAPVVSAWAWRRG
jgi:hypothetical protein